MLAGTIAVKAVKMPHQTNCHCQDASLTIPIGEMATDRLKQRITGD